MRFIVIIIIILVLSLGSKHALAKACFKSIISFGDSLADTGNQLHLFPTSDGDEPLPCALPPYGETFFHHPTGRYSDGRLLIDFFAEHFGLPLVPPFYGSEMMMNLGNGGFVGGVNFAVGGATALPDSFYLEKGVKLPFANVSLMHQLSWFNKIFLPNFCHNPPDCKKYLETSLVLMGEVGGNDYDYAFRQGKTVDEVRSLIPEIVKVISTSITELIKLGAVTIMVPGNVAIGCMGDYLTLFKNSNEREYDPKTGCLSWLNTLSQNHNKMLQAELDRIRLQNPDITIIYADYYNIVMQFYRYPQKYGFGRGNLSACCGGGGPYNINTTLWCGFEGSETCEDPSSYVSWDGIHFTEAAYKWLAINLLQQHFTAPRSIMFVHPMLSVMRIIN